jgi:hypothetical protein
MKGTGAIVAPEFAACRLPHGGGLPILSMSFRSACRLIWCFAVLAGAGAPVWAQSLGEPYAPLALRAGVFDFHPALDVEAIYSDNPGQLSSNTRPAAGLRMAPELELKSDWVRHEFRLKASGERIDYADQPEQTTMDGTVECRLKLDIRRNTTAEVTMTAAQSQATSGSSEVPDDAAGKRNDYEFTLGAAASRDAGRIAGTMRSELSRVLYGDVELLDGSSEDNGDRNYIEASAAVRVMQGRAALRPFLDVEISRRLHDAKRDRNGLRRDSFGVTLKAGGEIDAGELWSGAAGLQYDFRNYQDDTLEDFSGAGVFAALAWRPSRLTTISLMAESGFDESAHDGVSGNRTQSADITIAHALRENLMLELSGAADYSAALGSAARSVTLEAGGELSYALNRVLSVTASYQHTRYISFSDSGDYRETQIGAGLKISR